jgi:hypothetical protein
VSTQSIHPLYPLSHLYGHFKLVRLCRVSAQICTERRPRNASHPTDQDKLIVTKFNNSILPARRLRSARIGGSSNSRHDARPYMAAPRRRAVRCQRTRVSGRMIIMALRTDGHQR